MVTLGRRDGLLVLRILNLVEDPVNGLGLSRERILWVGRPTRVHELGDLVAIPSVVHAEAHSVVHARVVNETQYPLSIVIDNVDRVVVNITTKCKRGNCALRSHAVAGVVEERDGKESCDGDAPGRGHRRWALRRARRGPTAGDATAGSRA